MSNAKIICLFVVFVCVFIFGITFSYYLCRATECETRAKEMKLEHIYSLVSGCRVKLGNRTVPMEQLRFFNDGRVTIETED